MTTIATLEGKGTLFHGEELLGEVDYRIDVRQERYLKAGYGVMVGENLWAAAQHGGVDLVTTSGEKVAIVVTNTKISSDGQRSEFLTSGSIPGVSNAD